MPIFCWSAFVLGSTASDRTRIGKLDLLQHHGTRGVANRVASLDRLEADDGQDLTSLRVLQVLALVGVHAQQAADALLAATFDIEHGAASMKGARVHPQESELPDVRIGQDLEDQRRERRGVAGLARHGVAVVEIRAHHCRDVERRGQVVHDRVQQPLNALVLEGGPAQDRRDVQLGRGPPDGRAQRVHGDLAALDVQVEQLLVVLGDPLDHLLATVPGLGEEIVGDRADFVFRAERFVLPENAAHLDQIDDATETVLRPDRQLDRHRIRLEAVDHGLDGVIEVGSHAVHLVNECQARHAVLVGLPPDGLGLGLHAGNSVEQGNRPVEHAQRALHFSGEVHVAGRVDDIDLVVPPVAGRGSRSDRDAALLLLLHVVHGGGAVVHLSHAVQAPGVVENALRGGGLARVDVRGDPDVAVVR